MMSGADGIGSSVTRKPSASLENHRVTRVIRSRKSYNFLLAVAVTPMGSVREWEAFHLIG